MAKIQNLLKFYEELIDELEQADKDLLLELASGISLLEEDFANQSKVLKEHLLKLQLYGFESSAVQTIYDIYQNLFNWTIRPAGRVLEKMGRAYKYLLPFDETTFKRFLRLAVERLSRKWLRKPKIENADFEKINKALEYIASLIEDKIDIPDRKQFYSKVRDILGV
jgi:hypothetical protein